MFMTWLNLSLFFDRLKTEATIKDIYSTLFLLYIKYLLWRILFNLLIRTLYYTADEISYYDLVYCAAITIALILLLKFMALPPWIVTSLWKEKACNSRDQFSLKQTSFSDKWWNIFKTCRFHFCTKCAIER